MEIEVVRPKKSTDTYVKSVKKLQALFPSLVVLIFGEQGLTPYKLKLFLMPQLALSSFIQRPWEHMREALQKSNHHANKDFQRRPTQGG